MTHLFFKKYKIQVITLLGLLFFFLNIKASQAVTILPDCAASGNCSICDIIQVIVNIGVFIMGIVGALTLLFFVYGGFILLTSGGASEKVQKGKNILVNSVIGLAIVLLAYTGVLFAVKTITNNPSLTIDLTCAPPAPPPTPPLAPGTECTNAGGTCKSSCSIRFTSDPETDLGQKDCASGKKCCKPGIPPAPGSNKDCKHWTRATGITTAHEYCGLDEFCNVYGICESRRDENAPCNPSQVFAEDKPSESCKPGLFCNAQNSKCTKQLKWQEECGDNLVFTKNGEASGIACSGSLDCKRRATGGKYWCY